MTTELDRIVSQRRRRLAEQMRQQPEGELRRLAEMSERRPLDFAAAMRPAAGGQAPLRLIAEVKRRSPSRGDVAPNLDVAEISRMYAGNGAAAVSVLTEPDYFGGSLEDLACARAALSDGKELPLLMKDFVLGPYQIYQAVLAGADAILLIAACLEDGELRDLLALARSFGLAALVEVHSREELERVLPLGPRLIGINNRDLHSFHTDLRTSLDLAPLAAAYATVVSESGISGYADVRRLAEVGASAVLVGSAILGSADPAAKVRELAGVAS